jgi:hypothetical protein
LICGFCEFQFLYAEMGRGVDAVAFFLESASVVMILLLESSGSGIRLS